jgi:hypothetical protein
VVHTELVGAAGPDWRRAEAGAERARTWVIAAELVIDPRDAGAGGAPTPVGLQLRGGWHYQCHWVAVCRVRVIGMPVVH